MSGEVTHREQSLREGVAEEIRALMGRRNVSRQAVAKALGVSHTTIWRRLSGETALNLDELEAVARVLGVDVTDLLPRPDEGRVITTASATNQRSGHVVRRLRRGSGRTNAKPPLRKRHPIGRPETGTTTPNPAESPSQRRPGLITHRSRD